MKLLIVQNPMFQERQGRLGHIHLKEVLCEPLFVAVACLVWVAILPITGLFCAGIEIYDKVTSPHWA